MIVKIIGGICVIAATSGLGFWMAGQWKAHLLAMEQLRRMIFMLKGEIIYANAPLEEAFYHVGRKNDGALGRFFVAVAKRIETQQGEAFYVMWKEEIDKLGNDSGLTGKDRQELAGFGKHLGYLDCDMQERTILLYLEQLDIAIDYLREHQREKSHLYTSLGVMAGLFLVVVLC